MATSFRLFAGLAAFFSLSLSLSNAAMTQQVLDSYVAVIGPQDRFNSSGTVLTKVDQMLAQDRANFHRFDIRQAGDTGDRTFLTTEARARMPALLGTGSVDPEANGAILGGQDAPVLVEVLGSGGRMTGLRVSLATGAEQQLALPGMSAPPPSDLAWSFGRYAVDVASIASVDLYRGQDLLVSLRCVEANSTQPAPVAGIDPTPGVVTLHLGPPLAGSGAAGQATTAELALGPSDKFDLPFEWRAPPGAFSTDLVLVPGFAARLAEGRVAIRTDAQAVEFSGASGLGEAMAQLSQACMSQATVAAMGCADIMAGADLVQCILPGSAGAAARLSALDQPQPSAEQPQAAATTVPEDDGRICATVTRCTDAQGNRLRLTRADVVDLKRHEALRIVGCSDRALDGYVTGEEAACFVNMFAIQSEDVDALLDHVADRVRFDGNNLNPNKRRLALAALREKNVQPGRGDTAAVMAAHGIDPGSLVKGQPDAALFVHPMTQDSWMGAAFEDIGRYLNDRSGGMGVRTRWPNLSSFAGRELTVNGAGSAPILLVLGTTSARVELGDGIVHEADYSKVGGFDCIPGIPSLRGECLGLVVQQTGGNATKPWLFRAALRGDERPIVFGSVTEGREAFESASASYADAEAATAAEQAAAQAGLAAGEELETLPLRGVEAGAAFFAGQVYASPTRPDTEFVSQARIPFLAYHSAYANACANDFDGVAKIWRDVDTRLADFSEVPGNRFRIYEEYIRTEMPIQQTAYDDFVQEIEVWRSGWFLDAGRAINYYPYAADFLAMLDTRFVDWVEAWSEVIRILGCRGPTINRFEDNLYASHALIDGR